MKNYYIIDGNNVIGKIGELKKLQKVNGQLSREKLAFLVEAYFRKKKIKGTLHFDGHLADPIKTYYAKICYSMDKEADETMKEEIGYSSNPKLITVVSSDFSVTQFAKKCSCTIIKSEDFVRELKEKKIEDEEITATKQINSDEIKKMFGL